MKLNNEGRDIMTDATEVLKKSYLLVQKLFANKLDNIEEVDKFLKTYNIWRLNHEKVESLDIHPKKPETLN